MASSVTSIQIGSSNTSLFSSIVSSKFQPLYASAAWKAAPSLFSVLNNVASVAAKAYSVVWGLSLNGQTHVVHMHYIQHHRMAIAATKPLQPATPRLITPFSNLSSNDLTRSGAHPLTIPANFPFAAATVTSCSMDAAIFADNTIQGPDQFDLQGRYTAIRNAEHDAGESGRRLLAQGLNQAQIVAQLEGRAGYYATVADPVLSPKAEQAYWAARRQEAMHLVSVLNHLGMAGFSWSVNQRLLYPANRLTRTS